MWNACRAPTAAEFEGVVRGRLGHNYGSSQRKKGSVLDLVIFTSRRHLAHRVISLRCGALWGGGH